MRPDSRPGVSTFLEAFILIGVAAGGSVLAMGAASRYFGSSSGGSFSLVGATISEGSYAALESVTLAYTGEAPATTFTVSTSQAPSSASYCTTLLDQQNGTVLKDTCPALQTNPGTVQVTVPRDSDGVTVQIVIDGGGFALGSSHLVTVTSPDGSQEDEQVWVGPS